MNDYKEKLKSYADLISEEQAEVAVNLINRTLFSKKLNFIFDGDPNGVDYAIPQSLFDKINNVTGNDAMPNFAYSYKEKSFGELVNIEKMFVEKLSEIFKF
jgi:hypothetical protein